MTENFNISIYCLAPCFTGILVLLVGIFVFSKNKNSTLNRHFFSLCCSVFLWTIGYSVMYASNVETIALWAARIGYLGVFFIPVFVFHFISYFLRQKPKRITLGIINLLVAFFIGVNFSNLFLSGVDTFFWGFYPTVGPFYVFFVAFFASIFMWAIYQLAHFLYQNKNGKSCNLKIIGQAKFLLLAFIFAITSLVDYIQNYGFEIYPWGYLSALCWLIMIAYAIIRHQLLDIEVIIKKTLVFAGLFAVSFGVFAGFASLGTMLFENVTNNRWIALVPSVLVVVLVLRPLETFLMNVTDKFLFQKKYDYRDLLRTFSSDVLSVLNINELVEKTVTTLADVVKLQNVSLMLYDNGEQEYQLVAASDSKNLNYKISAENSIIKKFENGGDYIVLSEDLENKKINSSLKMCFFELGAKMVLPLLHHDELVGILFLGAKKSDEEFSQDDIDILVPLSKTLSIAITNAQLFEQLSEAQAQAAQREKMAVIGTLSAGINHEICNPLGIARGQCEMFLLNHEEGIYKDKTTDELLEKATDIMKKVIHETDRATVITRKLSSFAKPAKGVIEDEVQIGKELDEVISLVEHDLKLDNISITKEIEENLPCISADVKQLQEILFNIIRNGAQAIDGIGNITVIAKSNARNVSIFIKDTGSGISKRNLQQIFNPFFTTKEPGKGTGLGLFIVKQIVEKNGGTISVKSEIGKGTTFLLVFPISNTEQESVEVKSDEQ